MLGDWAMPPLLVPAAIILGRSARDTVPEWVAVTGEPARHATGRNFPFPVLRRFPASHEPILAIGHVSAGTAANIGASQMRE